MADIHQTNVVNKIFPFEIWTSESNKCHKVEINMHAVLGLNEYYYSALKLDFFFFLMNLMTLKNVK